MCAQTGKQLDDFNGRRRAGAKPDHSMINKTGQRPASSANRSAANLSARHQQHRAYWPRLPECCTYDQVFARIIELLSTATNSNDTALSRALVDELEVSKQWVFEFALARSGCARPV